MRPQKGQVSRSFRSSNMAPSKGDIKGKIGASEVKKRKGIVKKLVKVTPKKVTPTKVLKSNSSKSPQMGIVKSLAVSPKSDKNMKESSSGTENLSSVKGKECASNNTSIPSQENKKEMGSIKALSPERKKNKKNTESKKSLQSSRISDANPSEQPKTKIIKASKKETQKKVVYKQAGVKKAKSNDTKINKSKRSATPKASPKLQKSNEVKEGKTAKPVASNEKTQILNTSEVTKEIQKPSDSKRSDECIENNPKSRSSSPEKKTPTSKGADNTSSTPKLPKPSKSKSVDPDVTKKASNVSKVNKPAPKKLINKIKESSEEPITMNANNSPEIFGSDTNKEIRNVALPSFSNVQSVSPSGRKKLIGKVKPIARVKGTVIEKFISDPVIQQNVQITPTHNLLDDIKNKTVTVVENVEDTKKVSPEKDDKSVKSNFESSIHVSSDTSTISSPSKGVAKDKQPNKCKAVVVARAKKEIVLKSIQKFKKSAVARGSVVKKTPKVALLKKVKLAKKLLKVSSVVDESASDSVSSSDDVTYSFPENVDPVVETSKDDSQIVISKSAIKPKAVENLPKKLLVKNKKCQGLNRRISQAHSKEKVSKYSSAEKVKQGKEKDNYKDPKHESEINESEVQHSKLEIKSEDQQKSTSAKEIDLSTEILNTSDILSDSKNDADDEEERYSFPEIKKETKSPINPNKKKKSNTPQAMKTSKKCSNIPVADDIKRRMKLIGFWTGPKKYREASLNALAKVQCLYENENRSHVELGLMRTIDRVPPKFKEIKKPVIKVEKHESTSSSSESEYEKKIKVESASDDDSDPPVKRNLRQHPTGAGKYWEMKLSSSEESEAEHKKPSFEKKKVLKTKVVVKAEKDKLSEPKSESTKIEKSAPQKPKKPQVTQKKRNRTEVVMDLRDMVVRKRMASLNATAILAASYEKRSPKSNKDESTSDSTSSEKEEKKAKKPKGQQSTEKVECAPLSKKESPASPPEVKTKTLIVNQEADVTITGVYSTHTAHTGFCTVSEMQYRISATSHTQTSSAAANEKEITSGGPGPAQSYTPLGALSSMHPPGGVGGMPQQHLHPGPSMENRGPLVGSLGRRAGCSSAFSAPPHHHPESDRSGYYQPAGPLISAGPLHGGFKPDGGTSAGSAPPPQDPGYSRYQYPQPQQVMHYNPHSHSPYGPGPGYGPPAPPPVPPPRIQSMPPPSSPACYRPPPPAHRSHPAQHQQHPTYRPPPPPDNQVSPVGTDAYAPQFCTPCYQHPHVPPRPISYLDSTYQGCPCPMQSCPKNVHTGPATGNPPASSGPSQSSSSGGKRVDQESSGGGCCAVALNPSLGLVPPENLGPPSPARGSAGLDPPHPPRRARLGKAMARKSIAPEEPPGHTMLLMCHPTPPPPLTINTDPPPPKVETVKNDEDSGDDVIIIESPSSKLAPIDLSSSEENNCTDSKSEKDCEIVRPGDGKPVVVDLSAETKKELPDSNSKVLPVEIPPKVETKVEEKEKDFESSVKSVSICSPAKKAIDKSRTGTKRRCSNLEIDMEVEIDDSLGANGIGEHVKLQKRQKVLSSECQQPKKNGALVGYKSLMKRDNRLLNHTVKKSMSSTKVDKMKQTSKPVTILESDKASSKKIGTKRRSTSSPVVDGPTSKKKKLSANLLKSADKKSITKISTEDLSVADKSQKKTITPVPKAKSVTLLDELIMKNNLDRVIDCVARNIPSDESESYSVLNPAALFNLATPTAHSKASRKVSMLKPKKQVTDELVGVNNRTVLNINNNVVKKVSESECGVVEPVQKVGRKLSTDRRGRTKSKSPAALNRLPERKSIEITAKLKNQNEPEIVVKDIPVTTVKVENVVKGKKSIKGKRKSKSCEASELEEAESLLLKKPVGPPKWNNGWTWEGEPHVNKVYINNESTTMARCWTAMRHKSGDTVKRGDSILLKAGTRKSEAPFVARVSQLWENPSDGEMMVSLLWYYRPEHTDRGRQPEDCADEVFASKHRDANSVACIEDKCYVLTYNAYCRYRKQLRASEENIRCPPSIVPRMPDVEIPSSTTTNDAKIPLNISPDLVLFCRRVYDFRLKKVIRPNP